MFGKPRQVSDVRSQDAHAELLRNSDEVSIDDVGSTGFTEERPHVVGLLGRECHDSAASKEPSKLDLPLRTAHLGDDGSGCRRDEAGLQTHTMVGPDLAVTALGCD